MAVPPPFTVSFLHQQANPGRFSVRFEITDSVGAVQVRPSRDTTPTGTTGTLRRISAAEIQNAFLLYREISSPRWGELPLWPEGLDPMSLPPGEWVECLPDGLESLRPETREEPRPPASDEDLEGEELVTALYDIPSFTDEDLEDLTRPPTDDGLDEETLPGVDVQALHRPPRQDIPPGEAPNRLIQLLRNRNQKLEAELIEARAEVARLRARLDES